MSLSTDYYSNRTQASRSPNHRTKLFSKLWFQVLAAFSIGALFGIWQYIPTDTQQISTEKYSAVKSLSSAVKSEINQSALKDTALIEPLLTLTAPNKDASIQEWYEFALSFDDLNLGKRYGNYGQTTPMLAWYAYIAKHKPQAIYKLHNQGKLHSSKFEHLIRFGFLRYWDEYVNNVDELLISDSQAVLSMAYTRGEEHARKRVAQAFFKHGENSLGASSKVDLEFDNLLFAMKSMSNDDLQRVLPILQSGSYDIDPRDIIRLKLSPIFSEKDEILSELIVKYAEKPGYGSRMMSSYMVDAAILGEQKYIKAMIKDVEHNAEQPTNFYCAACGLALSTDGLIAFPLVNASRKGKIKISNNPDKGIILSRKKGWL